MVRRLAESATLQAILSSNLKPTIHLAQILSLLRSRKMGFTCVYFAALPGEGVLLQIIAKNACLRPRKNFAGTWSVQLAGTEFSKFYSTGSYLSNDVSRFPIFFY